ncbi:MAG: hypothetical protein DYG88_13555 [Chloroflexi bacterium CFX4]|nr:hypothetical protein [Chloroflexi bacterium CFX4]MDL1923558.1 hypothetical protein [Chloroflexi bacterium CFX3]
MEIARKHPRWLALLTLLSGLVAFGWLSLEENGILSVTAMGVCLALLGVAHMLYAYPVLGRLRHAVRYALIGALSGGGAAFAAAGLMFLKTVIHAHAVPDYPLSTILSMAERTPIWAAAGVLLGVAAALIRSR